jgi:aminoglycoside 3-N-acetyltransferase I
MPSRKPSKPKSALPAASWTIVRLGPDDLVPMNGLLTMFGEAFEDAASYDAHRPSPDYHRALLGSDGFVALAAVDERQVVVGGLAAYVLTKFEQERRELYIYDLAVASTHRRQSIATALIRRLQTIARDLGAWVTFVQADLGDDPAIALYTKLGTREDVLHFDIAVEGGLD